MRLDTAYPHFRETSLSEMALLIQSIITHSAIISTKRFSKHGRIETERATISTHFLFDIKKDLVATRSLSEKNINSVAAY